MVDDLSQAVVSTKDLISLLKALRAKARQGGGVGKKQSWLVPMSIFPDFANAA
jgi:hypothetical protein